MLQISDILHSSLVFVSAQNAFFVSKLLSNTMLCLLDGRVLIWIKWKYNSEVMICLIHKHFAFIWLQFMLFLYKGDYISLLYCYMLVTRHGVWTKKSNNYKTVGNLHITNHYSPHQVYSFFLVIVWLWWLTVQLLLLCSCQCWLAIVHVTS
jgi:hypothetical protein